MKCVEIFGPAMDMYNQPVPFYFIVEADEVMGRHIMPLHPDIDPESVRPGDIRECVPGSSYIGEIVMPGEKKPIPGATPKRERQYEHVKESELKAGKPAAEAKKIAASTVNAQRAKTGEAATTHGKPNPKHK